MTWTEFHQRMAFMADVIDRADEDPDRALDFDGRLADVERLFGGEEGLLLSLQHRWVTALAATLDQAHHEGVPADSAVAELAAQQAGLRALLDAAARRSARVQALQREEQRIVELYDGAWIWPVTPRQTVA